MMDNSKNIHDFIEKLVSSYVDCEYTNATNLLGITSVRNIIYILLDIEKHFGFEIDENFISQAKEFTVNNIIELLPKYIST